MILKRAYMCKVVLTIVTKRYNKNKSKGKSSPIIKQCENSLIVFPYFLLILVIVIVVLCILITRISLL
jgi:hypothetical protein